MASNTHISKKLLIRNLSPSVTENELRVIIREIDQVEESNIESIILNCDTKIGLLTFDSEAIAREVFGILSNSFPLGPNFEPVDVTFVTDSTYYVKDVERSTTTTTTKNSSESENVKDVGRSTTKDSGGSDNLGLKSRKSQREEAEHGEPKIKRSINTENIPNMATTAPGSEKGIGIGRPLKFISPPTREEEPSKRKPRGEKSKVQNATIGIDKTDMEPVDGRQQRKAKPLKASDLNKPKSKAKPHKSGSFVLKIKKIDDAVDLETFNIYLKTRGVIFAKMDFNSDNDDDDGEHTNEATLYFSNEGEALATRDSLKAKCAIGVEGAEAQITLDAVDQPYHKDPDKQKKGKQRTEGADSTSTSEKKKPTRTRQRKKRPDGGEGLLQLGLQQSTIPVGQPNMPQNQYIQQVPLSPMPNLPFNQPIYGQPSQPYMAYQNTDPQANLHVQHPPSGYPNHGHPHNMHHGMPMSNQSHPTYNPNMGQGPPHVYNTVTSPPFSGPPPLLSGPPPLMNHPGAQNQPGGFQHPSGPQVNPSFGGQMFSNPRMTAPLNQRPQFDQSYLRQSPNQDYYPMGVPPSQKHVTPHQDANGPGYLNQRQPNSHSATQMQRNRQTHTSQKSQMQSRDHTHEVHNSHKPPIAAKPARKTVDSVSKASNKPDRDYTSQDARTMDALHDFRPKVTPKPVARKPKAAPGPGKKDENTKPLKQANARGHDNANDSSERKDNFTKGNSKSDGGRPGGRGKPPDRKQKQPRAKLSTLATETTEDKLSRMFNVEPDEHIQNFEEPDKVTCIDENDNDSVYSNISSASTQRVRRQDRPRTPMATSLLVAGFDLSTTKASLEAFLRERNIKFASCRFLPESRDTKISAIIKFRNPRETTAGKTGIHGVIMQSPDGTGSMLKAVYHRELGAASERGPTKSQHRLSADNRSDVGSSLSSRSRPNHRPSADNRSDVGSSLSSRSRLNQQPVSTELEVTGRGCAIDPALMSNFLQVQKNNLKFTHYEFKTDAKQNMYAILHFNTAKDCSRARSILHGKPLARDATPVATAYPKSLHRHPKTAYQQQRPYVDAEAVRERKSSSASSRQPDRHPRAKRAANSRKRTDDVKIQQCCVKVTAIDESVDEDAFRKCLRRKRIKPYNLQWKVVSKPVVSNQANLHFATQEEATVAANTLNGCLFGEGEIPVKAEVIASKSDGNPNKGQTQRPRTKMGKHDGKHDTIEDDDNSVDLGSDISSMSSKGYKAREQKKRAIRRNQRSSTSITVTNIDPSVEEDDFRDFLLDLLGDFSELQFISISQKHKSLGNLAIVTLASLAEATKARDIIQGESVAKSKRRLQARFSGGSAPISKSSDPKRSNGNFGGNSASESDTQTTPCSAMSQQPQQDKRHRQQHVKRQGNPNDVVIEDIPRFVREAELATLISDCKCNGFVNVVINEDETADSKRSATLTFESRATAVEATAALFGKRLKGYCLNVTLAQEEQSGLGKLIAKRKVQELLDEIEKEGNKVASELDSRIGELAIQVQEIDEKVEECDSIAEAVALEQQKIVVKQQIDEVQGYQAEFQQVAVMTKSKLDQLQPLASGNIDLTKLDDIRQRFLRECRRTRRPLPIYGYKAYILETITASDTNACVIRAETGSGKSTQVPQYLIEDTEFLAGPNGSSRNVICTQPRRLAATSLAKRVAEEYGCRIGEEVGYIAGQTRKQSPRTRVTFMTDRALLNICLADKTDLKDCACVIIDEAHERSVDTDILLAMLKQMQQRRSDLKVVIMSATIDVNLFSEYFNKCPVVDVPGRTFPVDTMYCGSGDGSNTTDYINKAVKKAVDIHRHEDIDGDILVFLTSQNEIERACNQIASSLKIANWQETKRDNVIILPLHGKLQPEDQMKVFNDTPDGKRKIVFATNVAETSVTIPGIKYVVDSGMVKECQYDPQRNMSLLKVTNITQASAEQRKGRAGRTGPGRCYRLYTNNDYDEMEQSMKPEILRVHLGMAMLQLIQMGIQNVEQFDFVESPEKGAIQQAMTSLILLGAVDDERKLTSLGKGMADLSLEPRLAKLVLTGLGNKIGDDAITLASLVSAPGNIIFRGSSEGDQQKSEMMKLNFSSDGGDILTMLKIYKKWLTVPEKQRNVWCKANSMNAKTLRSVKENANEIKQNLKKHLKINVEVNEVAEEDGDNAQDVLLRKMLLSVYFENLSVYNGHPKAGYTIVAQLKTAVVHPSSVLKSMGSHPKWLIYGDLRRTSQDFVCDLTPVEAEWIDEMVPNLFRDKIDREALERNVIREVRIENVGTALMKTLAMKRYERLRGLEDDITKQTNTPCIIESVWEAGNLNVFIASQGEDYAKRKISEYLEDERTRAQREQVEVPVGSFGSVRHVVVTGGETGFVLMGDEYRSLEISNVPSQVNTEEMVQLCGCQSDKVKQAFKFPSHWSQAKRGVWGKVTFLNPSDAVEVKRRLEETVYPGETEPISAHPSLPKQNTFGTKKKAAIETAVEVTWFLTRSRGFGFVNCDTSVESLTLIDDVKGLPLRGKPIRCELKRDDTRVVYITNIDYHVTPDELENALKRTTRVAFNSVSIARIKPTGSVKNTAAKRRLHQLFKIEGLKNVNINILDPRSDRSPRRKAFVNFDPSFQREMNDKVKDLQIAPVLTDNQEMFHVRMLVTSELYCTDHVYGLLKDQLEEFIDTVEGTGEGIIVKTMQLRNRRERRLQVSGNDYQKVFDVRMALKTLLHGEEVSVEDFVEEEKSSQWVQRALHNISQGCLEQLLNDDTSAFVDVDKRRCVIHIHGKEEDRDHYKESLRKYFASLTDTKPIEMRNIKGGILRALVLKFGPWLEQLKDDPGVEDVTVDAKKGLLLLTVTDDAKNETLGKIQDCLQNINKMEDAGEDMECGICFCPAEADEKTYRLLSCGHYFCVKCLQSLLENNVNDKTFPIDCPCGDCTESLTLVDIRIILPDEEKQNKLFRAALEAFISQAKQSCLKFCPSPDCCMIYRQSKMGESWTCSECGHQLCSGCGEDLHPGDMTCAEYKISKESSDAVWQWARKQGANVKQCPTPECGFIEKFEGCNKVSCIKCKKNICWKCLDSFDTGKECYVHLDEKHGGCFDYP